MNKGVKKEFKVEYQLDEKKVKADLIFEKDAICLKSSEEKVDILYSDIISFYINSNKELRVNLLNHGCYTINSEDNYEIIEQIEEYVNHSTPLDEKKENNEKKVDNGGFVVFMVIVLVIFGIYAVVQNNSEPSDEDLENAQKWNECEERSNTYFKCGWNHWEDRCTCKAR
jgi:hypothetical protein